MNIATEANQWRRVKRLRLSALMDAPDAFDSTLDYAEKMLFVPTGQVGSLSPPREHIREHRRVRKL